MAIPFLLSAATRLVTSQMAKKAAKEGVKKAAKKFVKGKKKEKVKSKGGALVKRAEVSQGKTQQRVSYQKLLNTSKDVGSVDKIQQNTSYESLTKTMQGIVKTTTQLDKTLKKQLLIDKKKVDNKKKVTSIKKKKQREENLEKRRLNLGGIGSAAMGVANKFNIIDFFTNILLGGLILWMINNVDKMKSAFKLLENNIYASFLILRGGLQAIKGVLKFAIKAPFRLVATVGRSLRKVSGLVIKKVFKLGKAIYKFASEIAKRLVPRGGPGRRPGQRGSTLRPGQRGPSSKPGSKLIPRSRPGIAPKLSPSGSIINPKTGKPFPPSLKGSTPGRAPSIPKPKPVPPSTNRFLKKLFNITDPKDVNSLRKASPAIRKAGTFMKGTRIPVVGPMIVFTVTALDTDPETGGVGRAAFKAIGTGLGEFLGFGIPIPILGPMIGGLIGEVMGDVAYELIINKNPKAAGKKIMDAVGAVARVGGLILDWMKGVVSRFWEALPKTKLPKWIPLGLGGKEILDPKMFSGPLELFGTMGKAMVTALFQPSKDEKGKVDDKSNVKEGEEESTTTTSSKSQSQQSRSKRIQKLQKDIAEAEALLQVPGFSSGSIANITKQNLATNKADLAKLTGQAQTTSPATVVPQAQIAGSAVARGGETTGTQKGDMISGFPVSSPYGNRTHPVTGERGKLHGGIDVGTPVGTFVALSVPVEIMYAGNHGGYGYVIDAWAPSLGLQFRLAHLKEFLVRKGQKVSAGTALGKTGGAKGDKGAGTSTGPHLHFEVDNKKNGTTYGGLGDPSPYVQYLILSSNGPRAGASVTTPGAVASSRARSISGLASYEQGGENTIFVPSQQQQQTVVAGGGSSPVLMAASTRDVVNSYYKQQLLGFLYKQG